MTSRRSPGGKRWRRQSTAASPEAKAKPRAPPSSSREGLFEGCSRGVAASGVIVAGALPQAGVAEGGRLVDRHGDGARPLVPTAARLGQDGFPLHGVSVSRSALTLFGRLYFEALEKCRRKIPFGKIGQYDHDGLAGELLEAGEPDGGRRRRRRSICRPGVPLPGRAAGRIPWPRRFPPLHPVHQGEIQRRPG